MCTLIETSITPSPYILTNSSCTQTAATCSLLLSCFALTLSPMMQIPSARRPGAVNQESGRPGSARHPAGSESNARDKQCNPWVATTEAAEVKRHLTLTCCPLMLIEMLALTLSRLRNQFWPGGAVTKLCMLCRTASTAMLELTQMCSMGPPAGAAGSSTDSCAG